MEVEAARDPTMASRKPASGKRATYTHGHTHKQASRASRSFVLTLLFPFFPLRSGMGGFLGSGFGGSSGGGSDAGGAGNGSDGGGEGSVGVDSNSGQDNPPDWFT